MNNKVIDFPKIKSPFKRKLDEKGQYVVTPEIEENMEWVFEDEGVRAVDKLHGTNVCLIFEGGVLQSVDNRTTRIISSPNISVSMAASDARIISGVINAIEKKWLNKDIEGRVYGELVGPLINGNLHKLDRYYFVPFEYLKSKCHWKSWIENRYSKTFESIEWWMRDLQSLFTRRMTKEVGEAEGIVFHHPDGKRMAKLRKDMYG